MHAGFNIEYSIGRSLRSTPVLIAADSSKSAGAFGTKVRKVLIVDDERDMVELASLLLAAHGFDTVVANSALEALQLLETQPDIDALFSDVMMPGMNGFELAGIVEKAYPEVKVILTSGYMSLSLSASNPSARLFVAKPYPIEKVLELLSS